MDNSRQYAPTNIGGASIKKKTQWGDDPWVFTHVKKGFILECRRKVEEIIKLPETPHPLAFILSLILDC